MEEGEYGLTRRTCFAARRLELVAVAGLLSISWCALGAARLHFFFVSFVFFLRTHTACCRYEVPLPHLPLYQYRGAYRVPLMNLSVCLAVRLSVCLSVCLSFCLSVCLCVCVTFVVFTGCESCTRPISINPGSIEAGEYGLTRGTCFVARRLEVVAVAGLL